VQALHSVLRQRRSLLGSARATNGSGHAGINDWGGVSPVTRDYVNPERPWPDLKRLAAVTAAAGKLLLPRLPVYPAYVAAPPGAWLSTEAPPAAQSSNTVDADSRPGVPEFQRKTDSGAPVGARASVYSRVLAASDAAGLARASDWVAGAPQSAPVEHLDVGISRQRAAPRRADVKALEKNLSASGGAGPGHADSTHDVPRNAAAESVSSSAASSSRAPSELGAKWPGWRAPRWQVRADVWGALEGTARCATSSAVSSLLQRLNELHQQVLAAPGRDDWRHSDAARRLSGVLGVREAAMLLAARGDDARAICEAADRLRRDVHGDRVSYIVNRNINYTNMCTFKCGFCAFSKGRAAEELRGAPYLLGCELVCGLAMGVCLRLAIAMLSCDLICEKLHRHFHTLSLV
jgi:hypothetical protein